MSHPSLTPAQAERLEMLAEEAAEIVQACTKILRHGYESYDADQEDRETNRQHLLRELTDLLAVVDKMDDHCDVSLDYSDSELHNRWRRKLRYTHHQKEIEG